MGSEDVEEEGEDEEKEDEAGKKKKKKTKGKEKEKVADEWEIVQGTRRCEACAREGSECKINPGAIERWREEFLAGATSFARHPGGTNCEACAVVRKKQCALPSTKEMRALVVKAPRGGKSRGGSAAPSASSSTKRKVREVEVVMPPRKRARATPAVSQEDFWAAVIRLLEASEARAAESSRAAAERDERVRAAMSMVAANLLQQNSILRRIEGRLKAAEGGEEDGDEDEDEEDDVIDVPILDETAEEEIEETEAIEKSGGKEEVDEIEEEKDED